MTELNLQETAQVNGGLAFLLLPAFHYGLLSGAAAVGGGIWLWEAHN